MKIDVKKNTMLGAVSGVFNKIVVTALPFVMRTIMIYCMGTQYLGLSSLFNSILNMLNLAELGFGGALVFSMYKPIAENDTDKICALMRLYKNIYRIIGGVILTVGLIIMPFVDHFISGDVPDDINVHILFLIYLANTVSTYFLFAYKNSLLAAFQRNDITSTVNTILTIIVYTVQIALVVIFRVYYLYVIMFPVFTILENVIRAIIVQKKYPQYIAKGKVSKDEKKDIYKRTLALASHKIGNTVSVAMDSLVISAFLGLTTIAIFGNYNYIINTIMAVIWIVYYSMTGGIGNRMNLNSLEENYKDFRSLTSLNNAIICWAMTFLFYLYQPFMELWAGKENMLGYDSVIIFCVYFYIYQSRKIVFLYKDAAGLWKEDQLKPLIGVVVNVTLNIMLVKHIGINGVLTASIISFLAIEIPWESYVLYKYYFKRSVKDYVIIEIKALLKALPCWAIAGVICWFIKLNPFVTLLLRGIICALIATGYVAIVYVRDRDFNRMLHKFLPPKIVKKLKIKKYN